jgi:hypothetical protein
MENRENNPQPKPLTSLEKIKTTPQNIKTVAMSVGIATAIAGVAVSLDNASTIKPEDLHKELNLGIGTEYKIKTVPSQEKFNSTVVDPETGLLKSATPIDTSEKKTGAPLSGEELKKSMEYNSKNVKVIPNK